MIETSEAVTVKEVRNNDFTVMEFLEYLRYITEVDPDLELTAGQVWLMFQKGVRDGQYWSEVGEELGLPKNTDWY